VLDRTHFVQDVDQLRETLESFLELNDVINEAFFKRKTPPQIARVGHPTMYLPWLADYGSSSPRLQASSSRLIPHSRRPTYRHLLAWEALASSTQATQVKTYPRGRIYFRSSIIRSTFPTDSIQIHKGLSHKVWSLSATGRIGLFQQVHPGRRQWPLVYPPDCITMVALIFH
jgi:hypothetical protein